jgi:hypothetical protein
MDNLGTVLGQLEDVELVYVWERSKTTSNSQALANASIPASTFYGWPREKQEQLNKLAQELKRNRLLAAEMVLLEKVEDAARVLTDQVGTSLEDFIELGEDGRPLLNLEGARDAGKLHLVKKLSFDKEGNLRGLEVYDSQSAAKDVLNRIAGTPVQRSEVSGPGGGPITVRAEDLTDDELAAIAVRGSKRTTEAS